MLLSVRPETEDLRLFGKRVGHVRALLDTYDSVSVSVKLIQEALRGPELGRVILPAVGRYAEAVVQQHTVVRQRDFLLRSARIANSTFL